MPDKILLCYPKISGIGYKSNGTQIYSRKKAQQKLCTATQANKGGPRMIRDRGRVALLSFELENESVRFVNEFRNESFQV